MQYISLKSLVPGNTVSLHSDDEVWLKNLALELSEEKTADFPRSISIDYVATQVSEKEVILEGKVKAEVVLQCSRCLTPVLEKVEKEFKTLYLLDTPIKKEFENHESDLDIVCLEKNDEINLQDVVTEQINLSVPFYPICSETCKGLCLQCGIDLNTKTCECRPLLFNNLNIEKSI